MLDIIRAFASLKPNQPNNTLDTILDIQDAKAAHLTNAIPPNENAEPRHTFTSSLKAKDTWMMNISRSQRLRMLRIMAPLMWKMNKSGDYYKERFQSRQDEASPEFIEDLKKLAFEQGATAVKFVKVPQDSIFTGKSLPEPYAIVFTVKMEKEPLDTSPSFESFMEVIKGYKSMAEVSNALTEKMRGAGFAAYPGVAVGGLTDYARLAEVAGLGAIGYHGVLITPEDGSLIRLNTVYTNITNLPIETENPHTWVRDFCSMCNRCVRKCPVKAIFKQPEPQDNGRVKCIDADSCLDYFAANYGCAVCVDICPFSQQGYEAVHERFKGNPDAPQYTIPIESIMM